MSFMPSTTSDTGKNKAPSSSSSTTTSIKTPADWERDAREAQAAYCQALWSSSSSSSKQQPKADTSNNNIHQNATAAAPRQPPPPVAAAGPSTFTATHNVTVPFGGRPFSIVAYRSHDIVSQSLRNVGGGGGWDVHKTRHMISNLQEHLRQHGLQYSDVRFVDIGANVGWFTLVMASLGVHVIAVEPMPANLDVLRRALCLPDNAHLADRVVLHAVGLSKETAEGTCLVYSDMQNFGDGLLHCAASEAELDQFVPPAKHFLRGRTSVVRLDDLVDATTTSPSHKPIAAVKMDTEGHEVSFAVLVPTNVLLRSVLHCFAPLSASEQILEKNNASLSHRFVSSTVYSTNRRWSCKAEDASFWNRTFPLYIPNLMPLGFPNGAVDATGPKHSCKTLSMPAIPFGAKAAGSVSENLTCSPWPIG